MSQYIEDPDMPIALRLALIGSDQEYHDEVKEYFAGQAKDTFKISATAILKPTQATVLYSRHKNDIWIDPEKDCWHALKGSNVHFILEKYAAKLPDHITEQRVGVDLEIDGETVHIHGKMDIYNRSTGYIEDWKNTSASSMQYDKSDHRWQLNILYYLMRKNGYEINGLRDIYLFDKLEPKYKGKPGYPTKLYQVVGVKKMPMSEIKAYIVDRVRKLKAEYKKRDRQLTECTDAERWIHGTIHKIHVRKKTKAKGETEFAFSSYAAMSSEDEEDIEEYIKVNKLTANDYERKVIKGNPTMCNFCGAKTVCRQRLAEILEADKKQENKTK